MRDFRDLDVWHEARKLAAVVYRVSRKMPPEEQFGMTSQMRRAAISIPTNIAEGCGRGTQGDLQRFLEIAMGSASELESLLVIAGDLDYLSPSFAEPALEQTVRVKKMLASLLTRFPRRSAPRETRFRPTSRPADLPTSHDVD